MDHLIELSQLAREIAKQMAEDWPLDCQALLLIHLHVLLVLAAVAGVDTLFDDHQYTPGGDGGYESYSTRNRSSPI